MNDFYQNVLNSIKSYLIKENVVYNSFKSGWGFTDEPDSIIEKYVIHRNKDPHFESIIGGFYFTDDFGDDIFEKNNYDDLTLFYYIEKMGNKFVLTRHTENFERKTILRRKELTFIKLEQMIKEDKNIKVLGYHQSVATGLLVDFYINRMGL